MPSPIPVAGFMPPPSTKTRKAKQPVKPKPAQPPKALAKDVESAARALLALSKSLKKTATAKK